MATRKSSIPSKPDRKTLKTFKNEFPDRDYVIEITIPEFTSVCPKTGQPDFGEIHIEYTPNKKCVELKSLKFYMQSWRNEGAFYEKVVNVMLDDLVAAVQPRYLVIEGEFTARGGIRTNVIVDYVQAD